MAVLSTKPMLDAGDIVIIQVLFRQSEVGRRQGARGLRDASVMPCCGAAVLDPDACLQ